MSGDNVGDIVAGGLHLVVAIGGLVGYVPVLFVVVRTAGMIKQPFYAFLVSLGVSDCLSLLAWIPLAIHMMSHGQLLGDDMLRHVLISVPYFCWIKFLADLALLAFNRYCCALKPKWRKLFFDSKTKTGLWIGATWSLGAAIGHIIAVYCPTGVDFVQYTVYPACGPSPSLAWKVLDMGLTTFTCLTSLILYGLLMKEARASATRVAVHREPGQQELFNKKQAKMGIQTMIISLGFYLQTIAFYYTIYVGSSRWAGFFTSSLPWTLLFAVNPWIYLIFNTGLRTEIKILCCGHS